MARLLVVDDEPTYVEHLARIFSADGHEVQTAENGADAIKAGQAFRPRVLIVDWKLRDRLSGLDVSRKLRAENPGLGTIVITGYSMAQLQGEAADIEDLRILEKPFGADAIREMVCELVGATRK